MQHTLKALSILLQYPSEELVAGVGEIAQVVVDDGAVSAAAQEALTTLRDYLAQGDLVELQEEYVAQFDRTRALSLHMFEHVHGESRDRGQAMVDLMQYYADHGMQLRARELPDYLPLYLEFLSTLPDEEARAMLVDAVNIVAVLGRRLLERGSAYAGIFAAMEELSGARPDEEVLAKASVNVQLVPETGVALDKIWQDTEVIFGPGQTEADCNSCAPAAHP